MPMVREGTLEGAAMWLRTIYNRCLDLLYGDAWHEAVAPYEGLKLPNGQHIGSNEYLWRKREKGKWVYRAMTADEAERTMWLRAIK